MEVIATKPGFLGKLRAAGDVFQAPDGLKASWFVPTAQEPERQAGAEPEAAKAGKKAPKPAA